MRITSLSTTENSFNAALSLSDVNLTATTAESAGASASLMSTGETLTAALSSEGGTSGLPVASSTVLGGVKVGENLKIAADGTLSVDTASTVEKDNTRPVTAAAVYCEIGNISALLETI